MPYNQLLYTHSVSIFMNRAGHWTELKCVPHHWSVLPNLLSHRTILAQSRPFCLLETYQNVLVFISHQSCSVNTLQRPLISPKAETCKEFLCGISDVRELSVSNELNHHSPSLKLIQFNLSELNIFHLEKLSGFTDKNSRVPVTNSEFAYRRYRKANCRRASYINTLGFLPTNQSFEQQDFEDTKLVSVPVTFTRGLTSVGLFCMDMTVQVWKNDRYNFIHIVKILCQS